LAWIRATVHDPTFVSTDTGRQLLVLWDIDQTLIEVGGATRLAYAAAFRRATGRVLEQPWQFNGRTELAAATELLLTGNVYPLAVLKVTVFGLVEHIDLRIGAFGGDGFDRAELLAHAWRRAGQHLGRRFSGADTVIIGDAPLDVATGKSAGAHVVAVATGRVSATELRAAGADVVLADLTDTAAVVDASSTAPHPDTETLGTSPDHCVLFEWLACDRLGFASGE
jgi:hypothetical protein